MKMDRASVTDVSARTSMAGAPLQLVQFTLEVVGATPVGSQVTVDEIANHATRVRRYIDRYGQDEVEEFVDSKTAERDYEQRVDSYLSSPEFGERWARLWLDLARYTDATASWLYPTSNSYLYRDWVVRAFNDDVPFDEFVHRQLATAKVQVILVLVTTVYEDPFQRFQLCPALCGKRDGSLS